MNKLIAILVLITSIAMAGEPSIFGKWSRVEKTDVGFTVFDLQIKKDSTVISKQFNCDKELHIMSQDTFTAKVVLTNDSIKIVHIAPSNADTMATKYAIKNNLLLVWGLMDKQPLVYTKGR